ncbi:hypothetical protein GCM10025867_01740 [Frondihabitans sucicola]|uniref:Gram-positive cocci surface proteins LPxTG domain-containing protein n=1 Tax=Frondihabitans sucicola TaxID=1268041 RepID=A0ABM8GHU5_9MICO|nr:hypothetical protein GCM10025867_01740 [Frondihabitans sucicola]
MSTPPDGVPSTTTTPVFSGTGTPGSTVEIAYIGAGKKVFTAGSATVGTDGTWTITTSFADLGPGITKAVLTVDELDATGAPVSGATPVIRLVSFTRPPVQAQGESIVLTPDYPTVDGASTIGIGLATTGFAADESLVVTVTGPNGKAAVWAGSETAPVADADGAFSELITLPATATGGEYVVTVTGATSKLVLSKKASVLGDPTITSPTAGQRLIGTKVTFTGTGTPGSSIGLVVVPTGEFKAAEAAATSAASAGGGSSTAKAPAAATPSAAASDPTGSSDENIVVGAAGTWSVTVTLPKPGDYTAFAIAGLVDAAGDPVSDNTGLPVLAGPSADVEFVLAAPTIVTASTTGQQELAFTGTNAAPYVVSGGLAILLGAGLLFATRRRREDGAE